MEQSFLNLFIYSFIHVEQTHCNDTIVQKVSLFHIGTIGRFGDNLVPTETIHWHQSVHIKPD